MRFSLEIALSLLAALINESFATKGGICPAPEDLPDILYFVQVCADHDDCPGQRLCCDNGRMHDCQEPLQTKCRNRTGECKPKNSGCCPQKMDGDPDLCLGRTDYTCCLPYPGGSGKGGGGGGSGGQDPGVCPTPVGPGSCVVACSGNDNCTGGQLCCSNGCGTQCMNPVHPVVIPSNCACSAKQQDVLCNVINDYHLHGSEVYDPSFQATTGCNDGSCIVRGPSCPDPESVCLKKPILNLLECAVYTCTLGDKWKIMSLLNNDFDTATPPRDFCNGKSVMFRKEDTSCSFSVLKDMCEDVGGVFEQPDSTSDAYCTLSY